MEYNNKRINEAAEELKQSVSKLKTLLDNNFETVFNEAKRIYESPNQAAIENNYGKVKANSQEFFDAIGECSNYLSGTVAPAYANAEAKVQARFNS